MNLIDLMHLYDGTNKIKYFQEHPSEVWLVVICSRRLEVLLHLGSWVSLRLQLTLHKSLLIDWSFVVRKLKKRKTMSIAKLQLEITQKKSQWQYSQWLGITKIFLVEKMKPISIPNILSFKVDYLRRDIDMLRV